MPQGWDALSKTPPAGWDKLGAAPDVWAGSGLTKPLQSSADEGPSAASRFMSGANPMNVVRGVKTLLTTNLYDTLVKPSIDQADKAAESAHKLMASRSIGEGARNLLEAAGHAIGTIPIVGTSGAALGEQAASGDVAGALGGLALTGATSAAGEAIGGMVPSALKGVGKKVYGYAAGTDNPFVQESTLSHGAGTLIRKNTDKLRNTKGAIGAADVHEAAVDSLGSSHNLFSATANTIPLAASAGAQGAYSLGSAMNPIALAQMVRAALMAKLQPSER